MDNRESLMALWRNRIRLLQQYEAAIDNFDKTLRSCPGELWETSLWVVKRSDPWMWPRPEAGDNGDYVGRTDASIQVFSAFWNIAYHCIFHLDYYLSGDATDFDTPAPFGGLEDHDVDEHMVAVLPKRVYTRAELLRYLAHCRQKAQATIPALTELDVGRLIPNGQPHAGKTFKDLLRVNLRHLREHSAQLHKFLAKQGASMSA